MQGKRYKTRVLSSDSDFGGLVSFLSGLFDNRLLRFSRRRYSRNDFNLLVNEDLDHILSSLDALPEPLFLLDRGGQLYWSNKALTSLLGSFEKKQRIDDFWCGPADLVWSYREFASEFLNSSRISIPVKVVTYPTGEFLLVRVVASIDSLNDQRFTHQQRLETLGMLSGSVAHDFNNVLTGILGHLTYLKTVLPLEGKHVESLIALEDGVSKASQLSKQIVRFSKLEAADDAHVIDLGNIMSSTCTLIKGAVPSECSLSWDIPKKPVTVLGNEARLSQVLINLVVNARDAISGRGSIHVCLGTCNDQVKLRRAFSSNELPANNYAEIRVKDSGHGMSDETKAKIFEPYFSTKAERGTGLGLTTVRSIVSESAGAIEVQSVPQQGTEFFVYLPLHEAVHPEQGDFIEEFNDRGRGERILVVDDENAVRNVLRLSLEYLGYHVATAVNGIEALKLFKEANGKYDLVILDMLMPGIPGDQVFQNLREMSPTIKVLLISGFSSEKSLRDTLARGAVGYVAKPFTTEVLAERVRECLDRGSVQR